MIKYTYTDATISPCGIWRYRLERRWATGQRLLWIMLNPSTADATLDDRTIARCVNFSVAWGYAGLLVGNLFALRATNPAELARHPDAIGPRNTWHLREMAKCSSLVVCAWGAHSFVSDDHAAGTLYALADCSTFKCLGVTKSGAPRHPLYLPKRTELVDFSP